MNDWDLVGTDYWRDFGNQGKIKTQFIPKMVGLWIGFAKFADCLEFSLKQRT